MNRPFPVTPLPPLALTIGEPAGIGPDITFEAWRQRHSLHIPPFYLIGDAKFMSERAHAMGHDVPVAVVQPEEAAAVFPSALPIVEIDGAITATPGKPDESSAPAAIGSIRCAVEHVLSGRASAVVTNPIAKSVLYDSGFVDPGHTEYLARLIRELRGETVLPVMMLWSEELAVVPVTVHIALRDVAPSLTTDLIIETARVVDRDFAQRFGMPHPRIAVAGLNPHAGENGSIGDEDETIVAPAIARLKAEGMDIRGPLPADTLFHAAARATYEVALCMYHDQALIPIKTLAFDRGVNVTLGLPFVRTSPDHGTAFDIAGTGRAHPGSLIAALQLAARLTVPAPASGMR